MTPDYTVLKKHNTIELRSYKPMLVAHVTVTGNRRDAANKGFKQLADFIFGNNTSPSSHKEKIEMTAPVLQSEKIDMTAPVMQSNSDANNWVVTFVMPEKYTIKTLPKPNNNAIAIEEIAARTMIAIQFSGRPTPSNLERHLKTLQSYIKKNNISTTGSYEYAFYNPPWTLPILRRNEILFRIDKP